VASTMNRAVATCRQLAKRARTKVQSAGSPPHQAATAGQRQLVARFIEACSGGDIEALLPLLDPNAWGDVDLGPTDPRNGQTVRGARRVAGNLLRYFGSGPTLVSHPGMPGVVLSFVDGELNAVIAFTGFDGHVITQVHVIADPDRMGFLNADLVVWSGRAGDED
jgi:RNA polymerase sigma-70 factor, ECF subfamily